MLALFIMLLYIILVFHIFFQWSWTNWRVWYFVHVENIGDVKKQREKRKEKKFAKVKEKCEMVCKLLLYLAFSINLNNMPYVYDLRVAHESLCHWICVMRSISFGR